MLKISLIRPGAEVSTTSRSARYTASRIECVTKTIVLCSTRWMRESSSCITSRVCASRAPNGSSMSTMDGLLASARAIATRCFIPPERCTGNFVACSRSPTMSRYRAAISRHRAASTPARRGPNSTFWATVSQGKSTYSWKTTPRSGPGPVIGVASTSTRPRVGGRKPATMFSNVAFPQHDAEKERRAPGAPAGGGAEQQRVPPPDRVDRREEHRKERRVGDERDLRRLADPHPDDEERQHRQRRDRPQDLDDRLEQVADHGGVPRRQPESGGQEGAPREAADDALARGGDGAPELAGRGELRHLPQDAPRAGEEDRIEEVPEHDESRREAPHEEEGDDGARPENPRPPPRERRSVESPLDQVRHRVHEHDPPHAGLTA